MRSKLISSELVNTLSKLYETPTINPDEYFSHLVNVLSSYFTSDRCKVSTDLNTKSASVLIYPNKHSYLKQEFSPVTFIANYIPKYPSEKDKVLGIYNNVEDSPVLEDNLSPNSVLAGAYYDISSGMDAKAGLAELIYALRRLQNEDTYSLITAIFVPHKHSSSPFYPYLANPDNKIFPIGNELDTLELGVFPTSILTVENDSSEDNTPVGSNFPSNQYGDYFTQTLKVVVSFLENNYTENYNIWKIDTDTNKFMIKASVCDAKNDIIFLSNLDRLLSIELIQHFKTISGKFPNVSQSISTDPYLKLDYAELCNLRNKVNSLYGNSLTYRFVKESYANRIVQYGNPFVVLPSGYECNEKFKDCILYRNLDYCSEKIFQLAISFCQKETIIQSAFNSAMNTMLGLFLSPFTKDRNYGKTLQESMERYSLELSKSSKLEKE